jgi:hypothetical protein
MQHDYVNADFLINKIVVTEKKWSSDLKIT